MSAITLVAHAGDHSYQLTRRGRAVRSFCLFVTILLVSLGIGRAVLTSLTDSFHVVRQNTPVSGATVVVVDGDSLWDIARRTSPESDPRAVVSDIRVLNNLSSNLIYPGQVLTVPSS